MLGEQMIILRNILIVEIGDPEVQQDIQQERKIEQREVFAIRRISHLALHMRFDHEDPERLDHQVEEKKDNKIGDEFLLHVIRWERREIT